MLLDLDFARQRIRDEIIKRENNKKRREAAKPKNVKGEANPVKSKRKINQLIACEDAAAYSKWFRCIAHDNQLKIPSQIYRYFVILQISGDPL